MDLWRKVDAVGTKVGEFGAKGGVWRMRDHHYRNIDSLSGANAAFG